MRHDWMLRLYPRRWRDRYGDELRALVETGPLTARTLVDLLAGALDAHLHPELVSAGSVAAAARSHASGATVLDALRTPLPRLPFWTLFATYAGLNIVLYAILLLAHALAGVKTFGYPWENLARTLTMILPMAVIAGWRLPAHYAVRTRLASVLINTLIGTAIAVAAAFVFKAIGIKPGWF